ncbi:hypothetical protein BGZ63DRAFT_403555 [Mariannaea sp. PMI_226]|nr:hypothetical protein BGZ63DRAFT_403555 [Mariannaea sp. PMI_226]
MPPTNLPIAFTRRAAPDDLTATVKGLIATTVILAVILVSLICLYCISRRDIIMAIKEERKTAKKLEKLERRWKEADEVFQRSQFNRLATINDFEAENARLRQALERMKMRKQSQRAPSQARVVVTPSTISRPPSRAQSISESRPQSAPLGGLDSVRPPSLPKLLIPPLPLSMRSFIQDRTAINALRTTERREDTTEPEFDRSDASANKPSNLEDELFEYDRGQTIYPGPNHPKWPFELSDNEEQKESGILDSEVTMAASTQHERVQPSGSWLDLSEK